MFIVCITQYDIMELVDNSLSETFQVPTYNPHYITSDYETNIIITEETEVFITYIHECAGFRNVLGYYTYDVNNPPTTAPTDEEVTIIFPNISGRYDGNLYLIKFRNQNKLTV